MEAMRNLSTNLRISNGLRVSAAAVMFTVLASAIFAAESPRRCERFNLGWKFHRGEVQDKGRELAGVPVTRWHWIAVDGGAIDAERLSTPGLDMSGEAWQTAKTGEDTFQNRIGFAWFRTTLPHVDGEDLVARFAGVDDNATVYLNGRKIGSNAGWNQPFEVVLSQAWKPGGPNILGLLVENTQGMGGIIGKVEVAPGRGVAGPARPDFDDRSWRVVDVPHDWSIEGPFEKGSRDTAHLPGGVGWYRKSFDATEDWTDKSVSIHFDGVYERSDMWLNGKHLGFHHYGYTAFTYDLTPHLNIGGKNVLAVRVDNSLRSRWYPGSGIYRDVDLIVAGKVRVDTWGTYIATPEVSADRATVVVKTTVRNDDTEEKNITLLSRIVDPQGQTVATAESAQTIAAGEGATFKQRTAVSNPRLWSCETPDLYRLLTTVRADGTPSDEYTTTFGIRSVEFRPGRGLFINGKSVKLKGVNLHHDNGILGAEAHPRAEERRVLLMKEMGANAIRTAHNPPSSAFLDACDRHGMLVIDEAFDEWTRGKRGGYSNVFEKYWRKDMESMILRDRNHPSVIMWSMGNECPDQGFPSGVQTVKMLAAFTRELDPTRAITYGAQPGNMFRFPTAEFWAALDACGYNYEAYSRGHGGGYAESHARFPDRLMYGSESRMLMLLPYWRMIMEHDHVLGDFVWTGMDYLGEVGTGAGLAEHDQFPGYIANCGSYDLCGFPKAHSYYRKLIWTMDKDGAVAPTVHATVRRKHSGTDVQWVQAAWGWMPSISSWTWPNAPNTMYVDVYSGCDEVELFLNGASLGKKTFSKDDGCRYINTWEVPYEPGEMKAVGYKDGDSATEHVLTSAGRPSGLKLTLDREAFRANGCDLAFVKVEVVDAKGNWNPLAEHKLRFEVSGPATIAAVGNSNPLADLKHDYHGTTASTYDGRCLLVVRSTTKPGPVSVTVAGNGLERETVTLTAN